MKTMTRKKKAVKDGINVGNFIKIKAGTFLMGSPGNEADRFDDETQHEVTLTKDFELGETPVTQAQYEKIMGVNPSCFKGADHPVENVSWDDARAFIKKLNKSQTKYIYRLPTEAEWEYAARAGTKEAYAFPKGDIGHHAWFYENSDNTTHPVKMKKPNLLGLYDMFGNVWEWCDDWYSKY